MQTEISLTMVNFLEAKYALQDDYYLFLFVSKKPGFPFGLLKIVTSTLSGLQTSLNYSAAKKEDGTLSIFINQ